jgi:hypothetical protein
MSQMQPNKYANDNNGASAECDAIQWKKVLVLTCKSHGSSSSGT